MRTINPSSLLRLQDVQPCPLTSTHHTHLFGVQRTILHNNAPHTRHTLVVTATAATDAPKKSAPKKKRDHPEIPNMPMPKAFQQTVRGSFTVGGIGLHTADNAYVRVRPAMAGEGRYFVRVPEGTNSWRVKMEEVEEYDEETWVEKQLVVDRDEEAKKVADFMTYLAERDSEQFYGTFADWLREHDKAKWAKDLERRQTAVEDEEVQPRGEDELVCPASIQFAVASNPHYLHLENGDLTIIGAEALLAALEAYGVDNARIEIEGGSEVPVVDGSALGWMVGIEETGVKEAMLGKRDRAKRMAWKPVRPVTITGRDGAFVQMVPDTIQRITAGLDTTPSAPIVGQKWYTWTPAHDMEAFRWDIAPARPFAPSVDYLLDIRKRGFIKGGTSASHIVGSGEDWENPDNVRFFNDEPARHVVVDTVAVLSLLSLGGNTGMPYAHVLAYQADMALLVEAAQQMAEVCGEATQVAYSPPS